MTKRHHGGCPRRTTVLIVDDSEDTRTMYAEYLGYKGYAVEGAENGLVGLERAIRNAPDVLVLDLMMPGIDGFDVIKAIRASPRTAKTFIVVVTGHAMKGVDDEVIRTGADLFLSKPCLPDQLEIAIRTRRRTPKPRGRRGGTPPPKRR